MTIPNILTVIRISLIPIFFIVFYLPMKWSYLASAMIFALAGFTDWLDGFLARRLNQSSNLGAFLDPVADKLLVVVSIVLLAAEHGTALFAVPAAIIVAREIVISALREWMAEMGKRSKVAVNWLGKVKTMAQMLAILLLLTQPAHPMNAIVILGYVSLYVAAALTLWSMICYLKVAWVEIKTGI